jgi:hypothetical protein
MNFNISLNLCLGYNSAFERGGSNHEIRRNWKLFDYRIRNEAHQKRRKVKRYFLRPEKNPIVRKHL